ncbi:retrovirus-related pol polyprotein from transposon TNT 1-94 [Tanacetum coccineum]
MDLMHSTPSMYYDYDAHVKGELLVIMKNSQSVNLLIFISNTLIELFNDFGSDRDGILKRPTMYFNLWRYNLVRHRYSNPMIQPEPDGSTQGYPLVSVEVLRIHPSFHSLSLSSFPSHNKDYLYSSPINTMTTTSVSQSVDENLPQLLDSRGGSYVTNVPVFDKKDFSSWKVRDTKIAALRLKFNAFKSLEGEKVNGTFTRLKRLLNDLENNGVTIPQAEVNATFANSLPRKWLSMNQTQSANNSIKNGCLATLYGKYNYEEGLIDQIYESKTRNEFMVDLNVEYHERALLENEKRFYKRSGRVEDEGTTRIIAFMTIDEDGPLVGKADARSAQWVNITMKKQVPGNINKALGGKGRRKENNSKEVVFTKADESSSKPAPVFTSDSEADCNTQEPLPALPKLIRVEPSVKKSSDKVSQTYVIKKTESKGIKDHIKIHSLTSSSGSQASSSKPSKQKVWSIAYKIVDYPKNLRNNRKQRIANKQSTEPTENGYSRHITGVKQYLHIYSKESGPKVVFGDDSSGDTEGYGSVNCNVITFTMVAYVNGLKHNLISISQLCDANFKVLFTKSQGTILNQNDEVFLIDSRRRDVYVIDINIENLNEVRVKKLRSDYGTEFRNHKLEEFCDEKAYDVFRGRSPDISYFYVFGCLVHIHNHRDHLGKFDEKADDGFFLGYSLVAKAFRVFNIRRQEMEGTIHVTFSEDDEAISQSSTEDEDIHLSPVPQDRWSREKHIELVNIIREPLASITTRSKVRDSEAASAHECLYVKFLFEIKPKKLIKALEEEGWVIAMQ